jgi:hypothetical protein
MPFNYGAHGSLDLYFQNESPGEDNKANWLPAPKRSIQPDFAPLRAQVRGAPTGKWNPPPITKIETFLGISGQ